jgi:hypothetical protein
MNARKISLEEVPGLTYPATDVLTTFEDRFERLHKLKTAMALTNADHEGISLLVQLASGECVEIESDLIDLEDDYVEIHGGIGIPLRAIVDVDV